MSESDIDEIRKNLKDSNFDVVSGVESIGRSSFSTCFVINRLKVTASACRSQVVMQEGSQYRLAQQLVLGINDGSSFFHILVSHWPSRLYVPENAPIRSTLGSRLRERVDEILNERETSNIILMGDYNDEPYDDSVSSHLRATRDRDLIKKKKTLLYNPFWRHLCHPELPDPLNVARSKPESWGTYFHSNGSLFKWRTFDQMMFSSALLGSGAWYLKEAATKVIDIQPYTKLVLDRTSPFDHLPIISTVERKQNG